jgi:pyruvate dehydrogenase E2 component (dihydrolipoyllysine-residue acetyltransferase)
MPQMGESIAEGTLSRWLKKVGDEVKRDEPIFEISTDKVDAEIPAPSGGVLAEILVKEGQTVPVQTVVARLETEKGAAIAAGGGSGPSAVVGAVPEKVASPAPATAGTGGARATGSGAGAPPAIQNTPAGASAPHPAVAPRSGSAQPNGNSLEERLRTKSSPLVRKIAAEHGIELSAMHGSGIAGRVTKRDILQFIDAGSAATPMSIAAPRPSMHAPAGVEQHGPVPEAWPGDLVEPMSQIRRLTSDHMVAARRTAAHVTSFFEVDLTRIARIRAKARAEFEAKSGQKLTYLPFIIKVVTDGLKQHPVLNAAVAGTNIIYRKQYNIGIAVALDWGLIVPVIKNADDLSITGLTRQLNDLAQRARTKRLQPQEVQGATFSITNPGVFGSLMGTPIIPLNTSAILGLGAIEKRPKVITGPDGEDTIAIRTCAYFSLSFDHRIVDGSDADKFLAFMKQGLETFPDAGVV